MSPDELLVARFRAGDDAAFAVLHDRYRPRLLGYVRRMLPGARHDAEDVIQDVFMSACRGLRRDEREMNLRAWLYRVTRNRRFDEYRRRPNWMPLEADEHTAPHDPAEETLRADELRRLISRIGRLPPQQRRALLKRELEGLSYAELADELGVSVPAVKALLNRARRSLNGRCLSMRSLPTTSTGSPARTSPASRPATWPS